MQIFLPHPSLQESVRCLDPVRLGNQIWRECKTVAQGKWPNHPVTRMWRGYTGALCEYALEGLKELASRDPSLGYGSGKFYVNHWDFFSDLQLKQSHCELPPWIGDEKFHSSHRSALLLKNFDWFGQFGWSEAPAEPDSKGKLPYVWPEIPLVLS
jgi:hypothetical protein